MAKKKFKNKLFLKIMGFLVGIKPLGYLCLHNVRLRKMFYMFNYKSKTRPTCLFDIVRRKWINRNILTNPNPPPFFPGEKPWVPGLRPRISECVRSHVTEAWWLEGSAWNGNSLTHMVDHKTAWGFVLVHGGRWHLKSHPDVITQ